MNVLAVVAHPDDEVLGVGGTLAKHALGGDDVVVLILGTGAMGRADAETQDIVALRTAAAQATSELAVTLQMSTLPDNRFDSVNLLDIVHLVENVARKHKPEMVYTHSLSDLNIDHRRTHEAVLAACRPLPGSTVRRLLAFETPSATEWGTGLFRPTVFVDIAGEASERKTKALMKYASELRPPPHPRSIVAVEALAAWRGSCVGVQRAEAFELLRELV